jgi:hypothetical protein
MNITAVKRIKHDNNILFIGEHLPPRIPRLAKWLKRNSNYHLILLCHKRGFVEAYIDDEFDGIILFRNQWHLKRILKRISDIKLIHGFAPKSKFPNIARVFLKRPYIQDMQDVYSIYYINEEINLKWLKKELPHEKACLEDSSGIIAHSLEPNIALRMLRLQKPQTLFFPLYCDNDFFQNNNKVIRSENIHVVYAGAVAGSHRKSDQYGNIQFRRLIQIVADQKIHFHIYPSPSNIKADYEEYIQLSEQNSYFHFHNPVNQSILTQELNKYHFGILPFFKSLSKQSDLKIKYATTLKLFNYLEAGLPVIVSKDLTYQNWLLNRYNSGINIDITSITNLRHILENVDYIKLRETVSRTREELSIESNLPRLLSFYSKIQTKSHIIE